MVDRHRCGRAAGAQAAAANSELVPSRIAGILRVRLAHDLRFTVTFVTRDAGRVQIHD